VGFHGRSLGNSPGSPSVGGKLEAET